MSLKARRDAEVVDTVTLQQDTDQYTAVLRDGTIAGKDANAFGVVMSSGFAGDPVEVCRLGFCPIRVTLAADNAADRTELAVGANGEFVAVPASGTGAAGTAYVCAVSEEATGSDGEQTGAWVDCLTPSRARVYTAA